MDAAIVAHTQKKSSNIRQTLPWENASKKFQKLLASSFWVQLIPILASLHFSIVVSHHFWKYLGGSLSEKTILCQIQSYIFKKEFERQCFSPSGQKWLSNLIRLKTFVMLQKWFNLKCHMDLNYQVQIKYYVCHVLT